MTSCKELQNAYMDMYEQVRNYIWGFHTVEKLANLEIAIFSAFPDISKVKQSFDAFKRDIDQADLEDEELNAEVSNLSRMIDSCEEFYFKLNQVQEVL